MIFVTIIVGVVLLILFLNLRSRVIKLEERAGLVAPEIVPAFPGQAMNSSGAPTGIGARAPQNLGVSSTRRDAGLIPTRPEKTAGSQFGAWLKEDWLLKLGVLLLLIGFGWLVTYAFLNNWIGPMGRIAFGIISGALIMVLGWWRIKNFVHQGGIFLVLGSTVILMTVSAGQWFYSYFDPISSLTLMFLSVAFVALASVKFNSQALSLCSLILAAIAPMFSGVYGDEVQLFSYLMIIVLGTVWVVAKNGQRALTAASLIAVVLYSLPHLMDFYRGGSDTVLYFIYAFTVVFFITNTLGILKNKGNVKPDLLTAAASGVYLLVWIMNVVNSDWRSLIISAWMIVFSAGAFLIFRITKRVEPFYVYAGVGVAMLAAATSAELDGATLTIAYTIESAMVSLVVYAVLRDVEAAARSSLLLIGPIILSFSSMTARDWRIGVFHQPFFVLFVLFVVMTALGFYFWIAGRSKPQNSGFGTSLMVAGSIYAYILLWLSLHAAIQNDDIAVMVCLLVYTVVGLIAYIYGRMSGGHILSLYGAILLGFVVGRLLLVDVWKMELSGRIITFFVIGALLISTAFIGRKKKVELTSPIK